MTPLQTIAVALDLEAREWPAMTKYLGGTGTDPAWQFTDREGVTFYMPPNSSLADVRARYAAKIREFNPTTKQTK